MCAILQLVSAPLDPRPIVDYFRRSHPLCEHSYLTNTSIGKENRTETVKLKFASDATIQCAKNRKYVGKQNTFKHN